MSGDCVWKVGQVKNNVLAYWMMLVMHCPWSDEIYACVAGCQIGLREWEHLASLFLHSRDLTVLSRAAC